ncbi:hypothetical protein SK128_010773 [Halocaridina rubra]|uniref:RNase H type-1 domain-containing protein n=1 Tax=Halocaridina rubra TaxID=373956 RepID=A0AAN9FWS1_HALRR
MNIGKTITFTWIPSHVGLKGNEKADHAAKQVSLRTEIQVSLPPSTLQNKTKTTKKLSNLHLAIYHLCTDTRSASISRYNIITNFQCITLPKNLHRGAAFC